MAIPSWTDSKLGTMKRAALWLVQEVGEGNIFTKGQLRDAFPGTSQIDRRMRDLRDFDWKISTNREDVSLDANEQRFVQQGIAVWEPGKATRSGPSAITANQRRDLLARDGHKCRSCGIGPGEKYAGIETAAQLDIARRTVLMPDGSETIQLLVECNRCRIGGRELTADLTDVLNRLTSLPAIERKMLTSWIAKDARSFSTVEQLWADYRTLPSEAREKVRKSLS
ncbi:hypothetical protein KIH74_17640 [Kineosporia sp. J2-2]|uniref:HNH endonuclease n=1 Tax=Kineosporia corallincola TaxID=2835133 RepID=A0ABS5TIA1_9ACTN|nr:hypothetical protein [Kineosporia corallincola]MBT0770770.1 hypothetical protein [Kineosporia corallincola]